MIVLQAREDAPLLQKAAQDRVGIHAAFENLHGNLLLVGAIGALGQPYDTHTAFTEKVKHSVGAGHAVGWHCIRFAVEHAGYGRRGITIKQTERILIGHQQSADLVRQPRVGCLELVQLL